MEECLSFERLLLEEKRVVSFPLDIISLYRYEAWNSYSHLQGQGKGDKWKNFNLANTEACHTPAFLLMSAISSAGQFRK